MQGTWHHHVPPLQHRWVPHKTPVPDLQGTQPTGSATTLWNSPVLGSGSPCPDKNTGNPHATRNQGTQCGGQGPTWDPWVATNWHSQDGNWVLEQSGHSWLLPQHLHPLIRVLPDRQDEATSLHLCLHITVTPTARSHQHVSLCPIDKDPSLPDVVGPQGNLQLPEHLC